MPNAALNSAAASAEDSMPRNLRVCGATKLCFSHGQARTKIAIRQMKNAINAVAF